MISRFKDVLVLFTVCVIYKYARETVTFCVQLGSVLGEAPEANLLPQQLEELFQGGTSYLVVVHFLLCALPCSAVHHSHFYLKTQLGTSKHTNMTVNLFL